MVEGFVDGLETWPEGLVAGLVTVVLGFFSGETPVEGRVAAGLVCVEGRLAARRLVEGRVTTCFLSEDEEELLLTVVEDRPED